MSWQSYPLRHLAGFNTVAEPAIYNVGAVAYPRGHILHDEAFPDEGLELMVRCRRW